MSLVLGNIAIATTWFVTEPTTVDLIRRVLKTKLTSVAGIGQVHEFEPFIAQASDLRRWFGSIVGSYQIIHGWTITRGQTMESRLVQTENDRRPRYIFRVYYSVGTQGASELRFQRILEYVCDAFRDDPELGGLAEPLEYVEPVQVEFVGHRQLVGVLCHYAELSLIAHIRVNW